MQNNCQTQMNETPLSNSDVIIKAYDGIQVLRERLKAIAKEHSERTKQLQGVMQDVSHAAKSGQGELFKLGGHSLSPELERLLKNPLAGL